MSPYTKINELKVEEKRRYTIIVILKYFVKVIKPDSIFISYCFSWPQINTPYLP